jgi:hypothetical protein
MARWLAIWAIGSRVLDCIAHLVVGQKCFTEVKVFGVRYAITIEQAK